MTSKETSLIEDLLEESQSSQDEDKPLPAGKKKKTSKKTSKKKTSRKKATPQLYVVIGEDAWDGNSDQAMVCDEKGLLEAIKYLETSRAISVHKLGARLKVKTSITVEEAE